MMHGQPIIMIQGVPFFILRKSSLHIKVMKNDLNTDRNSLGILLIALSGRSTRIVLIAERFMFSTFKQYSKALKQTNKEINKQTSMFNLNKSPTRCNNFPVYYPDVYLQLNMFRTFSRPSSGAQ
jgi:hypothetical protein